MSRKIKDCIGFVNSVGSKVLKQFKGEDGRQWVEFLCGNCKNETHTCFAISFNQEKTKYCKSCSRQMTIQNQKLNYVGLINSVGSKVIKQFICDHSKGKYWVEFLCGKCKNETHVCYANSFKTENTKYCKSCCTKIINEGRILNCVGNINSVGSEVIKQFIGKDNRQWVEYLCGYCKRETHTCNTYSFNRETIKYCKSCRDIRQKKDKKV